MKRLTAALGFACAFLTFAASASALPVVGAAEDSTKYAADGGTATYQTMKGYGLSSNRIAVYWNYTEPTTIQEKTFLDRVVPAASDAGVQLVFALYADPRVPGAAQAIGKNPDGFCSYAATIASTYPSVTKIIVGNEPNQPRFWQPQFGGSKAASPGVSGGTFAGVMARCYDALKAVNPEIDVIGVGLSPRGNDRPNAASNISRSPVKWLKDFTDAYRKSGRTTPIMDEFAFHCYPNVNTDSVAKGYLWPNVGCVNLDRLKQALWDGFNGTAQPTPGEGVALKAVGTTKPLTVVLDETGWQVGVGGMVGYSGAENVPTITDATQASYYAQLVGIAACDPAITAFHFLYFFDSANLADFQSGAARVDGTPRASADAVRSAIGSGCTRGQTSWRHSTKLAGAKSKKGVAPNGRPAVVINASEDFSYVIAIKAKGKAKARSASVKGNGKAYTELDAIVPPGFKGATAQVTLKAWANPSRTASFIVKL